MIRRLIQMIRFPAPTPDPEPWTVGRVFDLFADWTPPEGWSVAVSLQVGQGVALVSAVDASDHDRRITAVLAIGEATLSDPGINWPAAVAALRCAIADRCAATDAMEAPIVFTVPSAADPSAN